MLVSEIGYFKSNNSILAENFNKLQVTKSNLSEGFGHDNSSSVSDVPNHNILVSAQKFFKFLFNKEKSEYSDEKLSVIA